MNLCGYKVIVQSVRVGPVRVHSKRRGSKASYHRRVQKKWVTRFGIVDRTPIKRGETFILGGHTLVVRADDYPALLNLVTPPPQPRERSDQA